MAHSAPEAERTPSSLHGLQSIVPIPDPSDRVPLDGAAQVDTAPAGNTAVTTPDATRSETTDAS
jgi:hypothetical protein